MRQITQLALVVQDNKIKFEDEKRKLKESSDQVIQILKLKIEDLSRKA